VSASSSRPRSWYAVAFAFAVALVATAGSLFYSNVWTFVPCEYCWYQRILMYPLVVVLGVAAFYPGQDHSVGRFVLPLSVPGAGVAAYHSWIQLGSSGTSCTIGGGCGSVYFRALGLFSIPNQALIAFSLVSLAVGWVSIQSGALDGILARSS
jgi:disulfide bond formation protein DsbB